MACISQFRKFNKGHLLSRVSKKLDTQPSNLALKDWRVPGEALVFSSHGKTEDTGFWQQQRWRQYEGRCPSARVQAGGQKAAASPRPHYMSAIRRCLPPPPPRGRVLPHLSQLIIPENTHPDVQFLGTVRSNQGHNQDEPRHYNSPTLCLKT